MELYQLGYFVEVARQRNFTRASERLHLAQPALSQQMRKLEEELGAPLFVRGRKQTLLTPAGEAFLPRAQALLALAETAKHTVAEVAQLRRGRLVIATIPSLSGCWLPGIIQRFRQKHPFVELVLMEESSERVADLVDQAVAEIGFLQLPASRERFEVRELIEEPFVVLVPATHSLAKARSVRLPELAQEPFVFYKGKARDVALEACRTAGIEPRVACESGELETIRALVGAGLGVAVLPRMAAQSPPKHLRVLELRNPRVERKLGWITRLGAPKSAAASAFVGTWCKSM
ncbi:MAG: LysR family transcriptional regulator [Verrucomicrobiota bacterium]